MLRCFNRDSRLPEEVATWLRNRHNGKGQLNDIPACSNMLWTFKAQPVYCSVPPEQSLCWQIWLLGGNQHK